MNPSSSPSSSSSSSRSSSSYRARHRALLPRASARPVYTFPSLSFLPATHAYTTIPTTTPLPGMSMGLSLAHIPTSSSARFSASPSPFHLVPHTFHPTGLVPQLAGTGASQPPPGVKDGSPGVSTPGGSETSRSHDSSRSSAGRQSGTSSDDARSDAKVPGSVSSKSESAPLPRKIQRRNYRGEVRQCFDKLAEMFRKMDENGEDELGEERQQLAELDQAVSELRRNSGLGVGAASAALASALAKSSGASSSSSTRRSSGGSSKANKARLTQADLLERAVNTIKSLRAEAGALEEQLYGVQQRLRQSQQQPQQQQSQQQQPQQQRGRRHPRSRKRGLSESAGEQRRSEWSDMVPSPDNTSDSPVLSSSSSGSNLRRSRRRRATSATASHPSVRKRQRRPATSSSSSSSGNSSGGNSSSNNSSSNNSSSNNSSSNNSSSNSSSSNNNSSSGGDDNSSKGSSPPGSTPLSLPGSQQSGVSDSNMHVFRTSPQPLDNFQESMQQADMDEDMFMRPSGGSDMMLPFNGDPGASSMNLQSWDTAMGQFSPPSMPQPSMPLLPQPPLGAASTLESLEAQIVALNAKRQQLLQRQAPTRQPVHSVQSPRMMPVQQYVQQPMPYALRQQPRSRKKNRKQRRKHKKKRHTS